MSKILTIICITQIFLINILYSQEPRLSSVEFRTCVPTEEICGNGIDDDCVGGDASCNNEDNDNDGFSNALDCDPNDKMVYPGISVSCLANCGQGVKTCGSNGSFTSCSCTPLCESKSTGRCFYVDPESGNDANPGNFSQRIKTLRRFGSYYSGASAPTNKIDLRAGDVIYMFSGIYKDSYLSDNDSQVIRLMGVKGNSSAPIVFKAYPGEVPVISPIGNARGINITSASQYLQFEGIQIKGAWHAGLAAFDSDQIAIRNMRIYDTRGSDNDNMAGIYMAFVTNVEISNSIVHDNYDRECFDTGGNKTENSRNMVFFKGGNVKVHHNYIYHTPSISAQKTGSCVVYKHSQNLPGGIFEVNHNAFRNCFFSAIGNGGYGGRFHHNLILNSSVGIMVKDMGGGADGRDNLAEYNTIINSEGAQYNPSQFIDQNYNYGLFEFRNNIVSDNRSYNSDSGGISTFDIYGSDSVLNMVKNQTLLKTSNNCYYNSSRSVEISFYSSNSAPSRADGGMYSLSSFKSLGFDAASKEVNPGLAGPIFKPTNPQCSGLGY